jgi:hypothetical protein
MQTAQKGLVRCSNKGGDCTQLYVYNSILMIAKAGNVQRALSKRCKIREVVHSSCLLKGPRSYLNSPRLHYAALLEDVHFCYSLSYETHFVVMRIKIIVNSRLPIHLFIRMFRLQYRKRFRWNSVLVAYTKIFPKNFYYYYLVCEAIGTAATPGLLCQPRVIVKMIVEKQMECRLAGKTEVLGEKTCPSATFVHHKIPHDQTRVRTPAAAVGSRRLTAWAIARPSQRIQFQSLTGHHTITIT